MIALILIDRRNHVFEHISDLATILPPVALFAFASFALRYLRWRWLLGRQGLDVQWKEGFLAYLSGFALTASPGKVGELMRIRYFSPMGVPPDQVIACFIFAHWQAGHFDPLAHCVLALSARIARWRSVDVSWRAWHH
jgi:hypothetical protein